MEWIIIEPGDLESFRAAGDGYSLDPIPLVSGQYALPYELKDWAALTSEMRARIQAKPVALLSSNDFPQNEI